MDCIIVRLNENKSDEEKLTYELAVLSGDLNEFKDPAERTAPAVVLVRMGTDYEKVLLNKKSIINYGVENKGMELARYLPKNADLIPCIEGKYKKFSSLKKGVRALIENDNFKKINVFIIAAAEKLFDEISTFAGEHKYSRAGEGSETFDDKGSEEKGPWENKDESKKGRGNGGGCDKKEGPGASAGRKSNFNNISQELLEFLKDVEVPNELKDKFYGESDEFQMIRQLIILAASCDTPVLLLGETGTGKEVVANEIHKYFLKNKGINPESLNAPKFIPVNCGAISKYLFESEMFGLKKGFVTGVNYDKEGLWKLADKGTLFLDEIGDLEPDHQVKMLRALENGSFIPVGGTKVEFSRPRIIAATNRDLFSMVQTGRFREDLYYRLRIFLIRTPSLKDYPENLKIIAEKLWAKIIKECGENELYKKGPGKEKRNKTAKITPAAIEELKSRKWTGNVRELKAFLSGIFSLFRDPVLEAKHVKSMNQFQQADAAAGEKRKKDGDDEKRLFKIDRLQHLRRTDEVVQACDAAFRKMEAAGDSGSESVRESKLFMRYRLIGELEELCKKASLFHTDEVFELTAGLKEKLKNYIHAADSDKSENIGLKSLKKEIGALLKSARKAIRDDINSLVD